MGRCGSMEAGTRKKVIIGASVFGFLCVAAAAVVAGVLLTRPKINDPAGGDQGMIRENFHPLFVI